MTEHVDATVSPAQLDRVERLRARRGQSPAAADATPEDRSDVGHPAPPAAPTIDGRRKRHIARASRIVAAGLGASTMIGIVGVLGLDNPFAANSDPGTDGATPPITVASPPPIQVVVHRIPAARSSVPAASRTAEPVPRADPSPAPIVLTANPVVQTVTVTAPAQASAPAPAASATTSGSH